MGRTVKSLCIIVYTLSEETPHPAVHNHLRQLSVNIQETVMCMRVNQCIINMEPFVLLRLKPREPIASESVRRLNAPGFFSFFLFGQCKIKCFHTP